MCVCVPMDNIHWLYANFVLLIYICMYFRLQRKRLFRERAENRGRRQQRNLPSLQIPPARASCHGNKSSRVNEEGVKNVKYFTRKIMKLKQKHSPNVKKVKIDFKN